MNIKYFYRLNAGIAATIFAASAVFNTSLSFAATDGTLGATTTGIVNLNVTKSTLAQISGLADISISSYIIGTGNQSQSSTACVYSSTANGSYTVKADGSGAAHAFTIADGASHTVPYAVIWNSAGVGSLADSGTALTADVTSATFTNAATDSTTCSGATPGPTAQVNIHLLGSDLDAVPYGTYTGTLTILITPV